MGEHRILLATHFRRSPPAGAAPGWAISSGGRSLRGTVYWERVVSPQVRAHMMCAAGKALCDASQLALPTSDSLARQGGDSDPHASCTPPPASRRNMPSESAVRNSSRGRSAFWVLQRVFASIFARYPRLVPGELEREHTQPSELLLTRAPIAGSYAVPGTVCVVLPLINQP